jgi:hypothetical protein
MEIYGLLCNVNGCFKMPLVAMGVSGRYGKKADAMKVIGY